VYSCFGILNISFLPFRHPIDLLMEDEIAGEAHPDPQFSFYTASLIITNQCEKSHMQGTPPPCSVFS
jgi:hypothetical protein